MKNMTIEARDKDGNLLGTREVECPENVKELIDTFDDKQLVKYAVSAWIIDVQAELRREARGPVANPLVAALKKATPQQREAIIAKMKELGL